MEFRIRKYVLKEEQMEFHKRLHKQERVVRVMGSFLSQESYCKETQFEDMDT